MKDFNAVQIQTNLTENFWVAYDALDINKKKVLDIGIELSKEV